MQKVVGSSPIIRFRNPRKSGVFVCHGGDGNRIVSVLCPVDRLLHDTRPASSRRSSFAAPRCGKVYEDWSVGASTTTLTPLTTTTSRSAGGNLPGLRRDEAQARSPTGKADFLLEQAGLRSFGSSAIQLILRS
jgi:hypothetical protein